MANPGRSVEKANILAVDDNPENLRLLVSFLKGQGYEVRLAPNGNLAMKAVEAELPDLILLDINMPDMNGYEVCRRLKAQDRVKDIPVIFISALNETLDMVKAFDAGGIDYITKPFQFEEVEARVNTHLGLHRLRLELEAKNRQLEESYEKLRELESHRDSLTHMIIHDLRSPLAGMTMSLRLLERKLDKENRRDHISCIESSLHSVSALSKMTDGLLDISRLEEKKMPLDLKECDLKELAQQAITSAREMYRDSFVELASPDELKLTCDPDLIRRVIENLVGNGIKHTSADSSLKVVLVADGNGTRVEVCDNGDGIPEAYREKIFEKFGIAESRSEGKYHSTGLGLTFCKLAVEAHAGQIGVSSEEGKGSTFWFTLPRPSS